MANRELEIVISAQIDDLKKDLSKATKALEGMGKDTKKVGNDMESSFFKASLKANLLAEAIKVAGGQMLELARSTADNIRQQTLWAQRLSVSIESFSSLTAVAKKFGADIDDVGDAMKDLNERIADAARGNKTYEEALKMIGLASRDLINLPVEEQFIKVADAIGKMNNVGDQNFATAELMADAGFRLLEVFRLGEEGIRSMTQAMIDNGVAIDSDGVESANRLRSAFGELGLSSQALGEQILKNIVGPTEKMIEFINKATLVVRSLAGEDLRTQEEKMNDLAQAVQNTAIAWEKEKKILEERGASQEALNKLNDLYTEKIQKLGERMNELNGIRRESIQIDQEEGESKNQLAENIALAYQKAAESDAIYKRQAIIDSVKAKKEQEKLDKEQNKQKLEATRGVFSNLSTLMNTENRKLFEIGKAAAIADATVHTYMGANKALGSAPPPFNFALAGAVIAAGLANVASIASQSFGGGGGGASAGSVGAGAGVQPPPLESVTNVDVTFADNQPISQDSMRGFIGLLNEEISDGAKLGTISVS